MAAYPGVGPVTPERDDRRVTCPDCDAELEPVDAHHVDTIAATRYRCPACGTRWNLDYSGLLTEADG